MRNRRRLTYTVLSVLLLITMLFFANRNNVVLAAETGTVTASVLNVRKGPGTSYGLVTQSGAAVKLKKNDTVTIEGTSNGWYKVKFTYNKSSVSGYVSSSYVSKKTSSSTANASVSSTSKTGTVTATSLNVRKGAGTNFGLVTQSGKSVILKKNDTVTIEGTSNGWYKVKFTYNKSTVTGYVSSSYVTVKSTSTTSSQTTSATSTLFKVPAKVSANSLRVRTSYSTSSAQLKVNNVGVALKNKQSVTIINEKVVDGVKWYYIQFTYSGSTRKGWVHGNYLTLTLSSNVKAKIRLSSVKIRKTAGTTTNFLTVSGKTVSLSSATNVTITKEEKKNDVRWYKISFTYSGKSYTGYVKATEVYFTTTESASSSTTTPSPTPTATPSTTKPNYVALTDAEFEKMLTAEGFPDSYKTALRALHKKYPYWRFEAIQTGLSWETVISKEYVFAKNTIPKTRSMSWISSLPAAYNYRSDTPVICDGTTWVTASEAAVRYYMDPRNFLDEIQIFQFEGLAYDKTHHSSSVVSSMLTGTPMSGNYTYTDSATKKKVTKSYVSTFMDAAEYSGASPYFLAARVKQEILTSKNGVLCFSDSVTGTKAGYEGYYNFYNIGANDSAGGGAVANGLRYAMKGGTSASLNSKILIPWNNQYVAIKGGAKFISESYISKGQNTAYLQKFNVTNYSTFSHQYMTNVEASYAEAKKVYSAYKGNGTTTNYLNVPIVFRIPVYKNMPSKVSAAPSNSDNRSFNNWLKTLSYNNTTVDLTKSPTKDTVGDQNYSFTVANSVKSITWKATTANSKATVTITHNGSTTKYTSGSSYTKNLSVGNNVFVVKVTAENGSVKKYTLTVKRNS